MIKATKYATQSEALAAHKEITGSEFYDGFNYRETDSNEWYVCSATGAVYYIFQAENNNFSQGERILNKLEIHSMISSGGLNQAALIEDGDLTHIHIIERNWSGCRKNRKLFSKEGIIITNLA